MPEYKVKQGDCIESIAHKFGHLWKTLWDDSKNADLRKKRKEPNVLLPGDIVFVPEKRPKDESGQTDQRHRFRKKIAASMLKMVLIDENDEPRSNESYILIVDDEIISGITKEDGSLKHFIKPNAKNGKLILGEEQDEYILDLGCIDPITVISGVKARLNNLGFSCGKIDDTLNPKTRKAIQDFQFQYDLEETGKIDEKTRSKLKEIYEF